MQYFKKIGCIYSPNATSPEWCATHAGPCFVEEIDTNNLRVWFSGTNAERKSRIGFFTINKNLNPKTIHVSSNPVLDLGDLGCFDESGVAYPWFVRIDSQTIYLYYTGWINGGLGGFINAVGLAISTDNGKSFKRVSRAPILERTNEEPISTGSVCVRKEKDQFKMWYTCFDRWEQHGKQCYHFYHIRYAESNDGIHWNRNLAISIDFTDEKEIAIAKPCVIFEENIYKMWYSYRSIGKTYRIGYAESATGRIFKRKDAEVGLDIGKQNEWDADMLEYAYIYPSLNGNPCLFYNGNGYGKSGIGAALFV